MSSHRRAAILGIAATCLILGLAPAPAAADDPEGGSAFHRDFVADLERAGQKLVALAEAVPADKFSWSPTDGVRTVSEVYMHVVGTNMLLPVALGATPPEGMEMTGDPFGQMKAMEAEITSRDEVVAKLKESLAYAAQAVPQIQDLDTEVSLFGFPASKRAYLLILLTHAHEHLGQSIAYARSLGVVPPWSRPAPAAAEAQEASGSN